MQHLRLHRLLVLAGLLLGLAAPAVPVPAAEAQYQLDPVAIASLEVIAEPDRTVVALDGSASFDPDPDGRIVQYRWEILTDAYDWLEINQADRRSPTATVELPGEELVSRLGYVIEFRLTVTDSGRPPATDTDTVVLKLNQPPEVSVEVVAKLFDRDDERGYDDNRNGVVDENEERYTIEGLVSRPGERGNAYNEWQVRAGSLLVLDASGSVDPDGELSEAVFRWERMATSDEPAVTRSLPDGVEGRGLMRLSTDEDPDTPGLESAEAMAKFPASRRNEPYFAFYRLTITDEDGASAAEWVKIVVQEYHDDPEVEIGHPESDPDAPSAADRRSGVLAAGDDRYVISPEAAEGGVTLTAVGAGDGQGRTRGLVHRWAGTGVAPSEPSEPGSRSQAEFTAPQGTEEGDSFTVEVQVADPDGLIGSASVELVVAETAAPAAVAPDDIETADGADGGYPATVPPSGVVHLRGIAFDADGDELAYKWEQVLNNRGDDLPIRWRGVRLLLEGSTTLDASFKPPEVERGAQNTVYVRLTVTDRWGVSASDVVRIVIRDGDDDLEARPGADQRVAPGSFVRLRGGFSSGLVSDDALGNVTHQWAYQRIETHPRTELRSPITPQEAEQGFSAGEWLPGDDGTYDPAAGGRLKNPGTAFAYFDAPELSGFNSVKLVFALTVAYGGERHTEEVAITVIDHTGPGFFSGPIDGPDFCADLSLGGPRTHPMDQDSDGTAEVCALSTTRRAAIARQNALETLAAIHPEDFKTALHGPADDPATAGVDESDPSQGSCHTAPNNLDGDSEDLLDEDVCGPESTKARRVSPPPKPVDPSKAARFFAGPTIAGPQYCSNLGLGGPRLFAHDSDGDGTADVCALAWTRREAAARHAALEAAFSDHPQYPAALAAACAALGTLDFGDSPGDLAQDPCSVPPHQPKGQPLPTPDRP